MWFHGRVKKGQPMKINAYVTASVLAVGATLPPCRSDAAVENSAAPRVQRKPNIVFAFGDDYGRYAGVYAARDGASCINELIRTPNIDRVATEGVLFTNAFAPAPSCTPCRSSLLSGRYFFQTGRGAILQGAVWDQSIPSYPLTLEAHGYHIGYSCKVWSPGSPRNAPYGGKRTRYQSAGDHFGWNFSRYATKMMARGKSRDAAKQILYDEVLANFNEFLGARKDDKPFCYWWGPTNTHRSWQRGSGKNLWGLNPDDLKGRMPAFLPDVPEIREDFCDYLGECQAFDAGLGVIIKRLEEIGELDNTLIVVAGDHGIPGFPRGKCNLYDLGCQVTLAARWPGRIAPGRVVEDFVNLMDLAPTFCEAGGVPVPKTMIAKSLMPILLSPDSGQIDDTRTFVVTGRERHARKAREGELPYPQRAIRTKDFLYIRNFKPDRYPAGDPAGKYGDIDGSPTKTWMVEHRADKAVRPMFELGFGKRPAEELYDLRRDPDHMRNLAAIADYEATRRELSAKLMRVLTEQKDPRVIENPCRYEHPPYAGGALPKNSK